MRGLVPNLAVAAYAICVLAFLLWQGLRGMARIRAVVDYLDLRDRRYPAVRELPAPPLARQAALPVPAIAVLVAGLALIPLVEGVASDRVAVWMWVVGILGLALAAAVVVVANRSPWAETRALVWEASVSGPERRDELLREALETDPQVAGVLAEPSAREARGTES